MFPFSMHVRLLINSTWMHVQNKNLKFSGACTHNLTCRWLAKWGIKIASERMQRQLMEQRTTVDDLEAENLPFTFPVSSGEDIRAAPCVYTRDLVSMVLSYLDELEK